MNQRLVCRLVLLACLPAIPAVAVESTPQTFGSLNGVTLFTADDGITGTELWRTDGTPQGTYMVRDIGQP